MKKIINYRDRGITLVALVITIIILLILAGVTLNTVLNENGLFQKAKLAGEKYKEAEEEEQSELNNIAEELDKISIDYNDYIGSYVEGYNITNKKESSSPFLISKETSGLSVGDKKDDNNIEITNLDENGNQKFTTEEEIKWKIWDYDKYTKKIRLISSKPTNSNLTLKGASGYNNGVWAINEICRQCYGQYEQGTTNLRKGIIVSNLKRSDIQKISKYDYTQYKHEPNNIDDSDKGTIYFGSSKTYTNSYYPAMWKNFDSKWNYGYDGETETGTDKEALIWEQEHGYSTITEIENESNSTEFKQTYYHYNYLNKQNQFINEKYYDLLFKNEESTENLKNGYWLSGRYAHLLGEWCDLGMNKVFLRGDGSDCFVTGDLLMNSLRFSI